MATAAKRLTAGETRRRVTVDLELSEMRQLNSLALAGERSRSQQIRLAIREHLEREARKRR
jgi:metal-responsive CopG/Arc/MetJ family transcriptional regulator